MIRAFIQCGALGLVLLCGASCAYLNTFYNAEQAFAEGERLSGGGSGDPPSAEARAAYEKAAEKSAIVLKRHGDSRYADDALLLMGRALQRLGRHPDAAAALERLLARFPESDLAPRARLALARSRRISGDPLAARAALAPLFESGGAAPETGLEAEILHERALIALSAGRHEEAVLRFEEMLGREPDYARRGDLMLRFAEVLRAAGRVESALDTYARYREVAADPGARRRAGIQMAEVMIEQGRTDEVSRLYATLLEESPSDSISAAVHLARGLMAEDAGRIEDAVADYRRAKGLLPGSEIASRAALREGRIAWLVEKRREEALDILLDAFLHAPVSAYGDSARTMARGLAKVIHYRSLAREANELDPALRATAEFRHAEEILLQEKDPATAIAAYESVVEGYPESPWAPRAMLAIGILEAREGRSAEARRRLEALIERYPESPEADSARVELGRTVPDRGPGFYGSSEELVRLADVLPRVEDPMMVVSNELDRYTGRRRGEVATRETPADTATPEPVLEDPARVDPPQPLEPAGRVE